MGYFLLHGYAIWNLRMPEQPISAQWLPSSMIKCKTMDAYVDDILVKSKEEEDHIDALSQVFKRLVLYKLRLNPQKCVFRVKSGKLLGFLVSKKGIEVDPAKAKAIIDMPPPTTLKELHVAFRDVCNQFGDSYPILP